jgi:VWFA-related protein
MLRHTSPPAVASLLLVAALAAAQVSLPQAQASLPQAQASLPQAQEPAPQEPPSAEPEQEFFEAIRVNVVNIDVFVEDRQGNPITGLTADDFELQVDGRTVPIGNFYAATEERLLASPERRPAPGPPPAPEPEPETGPPPDQRLQLVFYVDNFNLRAPDRNRVLRSLQRFVSAEVPAGTPMMLISYDHSLNVRQPFTTDPLLILDAAAEVEKLSGLAAGRDADRRIALGEIDEADDEFEALATAASYAEARQTELALPMEALTRFMEPLGGLPGRKALVYVSSGLPKRVGEDLFVYIESRFQRSRARMRSFTYDLTGKYEELTRAANTSGVTLYTLDAGGLMGFDSLSAEEGGSVQGGSFVEVDSVNRANLQAPLHQLAHATGGRALTNSNNLELMFGQLLQDITTYYSLGYEATPADEQRFRRVEVEVKVPGARVRHRNGFRLLSQERRLEQGLLAALALGQEGNRFGLRPVVGRPAPADNGAFRVAVDIQIPLAEITLVPSGEHWLGRLLVAVQAMDEQGRSSPLARSEPLELRIPDADHEAALEQHVTWSAELVMRPGRQRLVVGLADLLSGELGYTLGALDVPGG